MKKWIKRTAAVLALSLTLSGCSLANGEGSKAKETEMAEETQGAYSMAQLFDRLVRVDKGNYYPGEYMYGTGMDAITAERGKALPYNETESVPGTEAAARATQAEMDVYYYRDSFSMDSGGDMDVMILYYGDGGSRNELQQVRYLFPFQSKEQCRSICQEFIEWLGSKGTEDTRVLLKLEDLYQETYNTDIAISGQGHQTYMSSGIKWKDDVADPNDLEQDVFFIQLYNPAPMHL